MRDLEGHAREFTDRDAFAYSVLDGDEVIGCLYIDPSQNPDTDAGVRSWVTADRADMDPVVWQVSHPMAARGVAVPALRILRSSVIGISPP